MSAHAAEFVGRWRRLSAMQGGRDVTDLCDPEIVYRLDGSRLTIASIVGRVEGTCVLDRAAEPPRIDMSYPYQEETLTTHGIYRLEGNRLTVCYGGSQRPDSFDGTIKDGRIVIHYERIEDEPD